QNARIARKNLNDLPTLKKYGPLPQPEAAPQVAETKPAAAAQNHEAEDDSAQEHPAAAPAEPLPDQRKVQFLKGKLLKVDCAQTPAAVLTVAAGAKTLRLRAENFKALTLIGADAFSCDWKNRLVSVNYKAGGKADGDLVSLECQELTQIKTPSGEAERVPVVGFGALCADDVGCLEAFRPLQQIKFNRF